MGEFGSSEGVSSRLQGSFAGGVFDHESCIALAGWWRLHLRAISGAVSVIQRTDTQVRVRQRGGTSSFGWCLCVVGGKEEHVASSLPF